MLRGIVTDTGFDKLTAAITQRRNLFAQPLDWSGLQQRFGLPDGFRRRDLAERRVYLGGEVELIRSILPALIESGGNNAKAADQTVWL